MKKTDWKELEDFMSYLKNNFSLETFIKFLDLKHNTKSSLIDNILLCCSKNKSDYKKLLKKKNWIPHDDDLITWLSDNFKEEKDISCFNHDEHLYYNLTIYSSKVNKKYYVIANHQDPVESRYNCLKNFKDKKMAINFAKNKMKEIKSLSVYI